MFYRIYFFALLCFLPLIGSAEPVDSLLTQTDEKTKTVEFTPPEGWLSADPKALPKHVFVMVLGKGKKEFPPSINLGMSPFKGTLKDYLKNVKAINDAHGIEWKDLGSIRTEAGVASLSQIDMATKWGEVREMHVILVKDDMVYILTAAALKEEFPAFYKEFFKSMRSLRFNMRDSQNIISGQK